MKQYNKINRLDLVIQQIQKQTEEIKKIDMPFYNDNLVEEIRKELSKDHTLKEKGKIVELFLKLTAEL
jgi:hypothetical protein